MKIAQWGEKKKKMDLPIVCTHGIVVLVCVGENSPGLVAGRVCGLVICHCMIAYKEGIKTDSDA